MKPLTPAELAELKGILALVERRAGVYESGEVDRVLALVPALVQRVDALEAQQPKQLSLFGGKRR